MRQPRFFANVRIPAGLVSAYSEVPQGRCSVQKDRAPLAEAGEDLVWRDAAV